MNSMRNATKLWGLNLSADEESRPELLSKIMIFGITVCSFAVLGDVIVSRKVEGPIIGGTLVLLFIFIYWLNHRGKTKLGSVLFIAVVWVLFPFLSMISKGIHDPLLSGHFVVILLAGILVGRYAAMWAGLLSIISAGVVAYATKQGWVTDVLKMEAYTMGIVYAAVFLVCAVVLYLLLQDISKNLSARAEAINDLAGEIEARKDVEEQLRHEVFHDALTRLPNRVLFHDRVDQAILRQRRHPDQMFAVLFLDLDRFKLVNDSLGHSCGDELLVIVAERLTDCVREVDTVARMGGDEFAVLLEDILQLEEVHVVAERIHQSLAAPMRNNEQELHVAASLGIAVTDPQNQSPEDYLRDADLAMYHAKNLGGHKTSLFSSSLRQETDLRVALESDLRNAIEHSELFLNYQPIYAVEGGRIIGCEALLRWMHPRLGLVSPATLIPIAEETGLIIPIGEWVLETACQQAYAWTQQFDAYGELKISVNVSAKQLAAPSFAERVIEILEVSRLEPDQLSIEVTESTIVSDKHLAEQVLMALKQHGISIHMDDFGTGYSALGQVSTYPLDHLKIDRSFIDKMDAMRKDAGLVRTIISMAREFDLRVIAEGVETAEQLELLAELGCDLAQGFFLSKPLAVADMSQLLWSLRPQNPAEPLGHTPNGKYNGRRESKETQPNFTEPKL